MRLNHFSIIQKTDDQQNAELTELGFNFSSTGSAKAHLEHYLTTAPIHMTSIAANDTQSVLEFLKSDSPLTWDIFYSIGLQLLGFVAHFDFQLSNAVDFAQSINIPMIELSADEPSADATLSAIYLLLNTRRQNGMSLVEHWVSEGMLPLDNHYHFFNDKSLATFDTSRLIREVVYVESAVDTENRGSYDLIKIEIIRPHFDGQLPVVMTASPYHFGTNIKANDAKLYDMAGHLAEKRIEQIKLHDTPLHLPDYPKTDIPMADQNQATELFTHTWTYSLNDYLLARGFASIYVASVGTRDSDGFQTSGDYQQIAGVTAVIDWLNGRARAFTTRQKTRQIKADWANGHVAMTGKSYLGTLAYGAATTGIVGLDVILAEAGITNWYDYYRENGLVRSPGGYPGEDLDVLAELTYSRNLDGADFVANNPTYQKQLADMSQALDRTSGDMNNFWQARNYLPNIKQVKADVLIVQGLQDFNVTPSHAFKFWQALPSTVTKHAFLHQGSHIYMNNWQSIDFSETINAYFTAKLLDRELTLTLPPVIWQQNSIAQTFESLAEFGSLTNLTLPLDKTDAEQTFDNHYPETVFNQYSQDFHRFKADLFDGKANACLLDITLPQTLQVNGQIRLDLRLKLNDTKGLLSAQILDASPRQQLSDVSSLIDPKAIDRGRNFMLDDLRELSLTKKAHHVVTKGFVNLQNRNGLTEVTSIPADEWFEVSLALQPTIYNWQAGDCLRIVLYSTDFEHTIRDNREVTYTIDLSQSHLTLPITSEDKPISN